MTAPTITNVSPSVAAAGTLIVVTGTGFSQVTAVKVGPAANRVSVPPGILSDTSLSFVAPVGITGPDDIELDYPADLVDVGGFTETAAPPPPGKIARPGFQMRAPALPPAAYDAVIHGDITEQPWAALEPQEGNYVETSLDASLKTLRAYNAAHPTTLRGSIARFNAQISVPGWLCVGSGGPVAVSSPGSVIGGQPRSGFDARWWTPFMEGRHALLMAHFGPLIDAAPEIVRATVCGPGEIYDEVFVRFAGNVAALAAAGMTPANDEASFFVYVDNCCANLKRTSIMLDVGNYAAITSASLGSLTFTKTVVDHLIAHAPVRPTLAQASLNAGNVNQQTFAFMAGYGPHGTKQATLRMQLEPGVAGADFVTCVEAAISYGVSELEVSSDYVNQPMATLARLDAALQANAY